MPELITQRLSFALSNPTSNKDGSYEILAITSGLGNGWKFSAATLQKSLSLWDGVHCFLDHLLGKLNPDDHAKSFVQCSLKLESQFERDLG